MLAAQVGLVAFGVAARLWILARPMGALDSDEAVIGLMARQILHGQLPTFFWGQSYGGSHEAILAAALFALVGPSTLALKAVPLALSAVAALLTWRIGRLLLGEAAGRWAGVVFWAWPPAFVWWATKASVYWGSLCLALVALLELCRLGARAAGTPAGGTREIAEAGICGLFTGLAWWANPQTLCVLVPAYLWFAPALLRRRRLLPVLGALALVGAAPWIRYNLVHQWASLHFPPQAAAGGGYPQRVRGFFQVALPIALGWRISFTEAWVLGGAGVAATVVLVAGFAVWLSQAAIRSLRSSGARPPREVILVGLMAATYPFLFAISPYSWFVAHPRYLLFLSPTLALLLGYALGHPGKDGARQGAVRWAWVPVTGIALALSVGGLIAMDAPGVTAPNAPDVGVPASLAPLEALLTRYQVQTAFADYWLAYATTFETHEATVVTPTYVVRDQAIDQQVRRSPAPAYLFVTRSITLTRFEAACARLSIPVELHGNGPFTLALPQRKLLPEQLGPIWQL